MEDEKALLEEKLARQQAQLRDSIVARDAKIRELNAALSARIEHQSYAATPANLDQASELGTLHALVADLRKLLDREVQRRERAEKRAEELAAASGKSEHARLLLEEEAGALRAELDAVEAQLASTDTGEEMTESGSRRHHDSLCRRKTASGRAAAPSRWASIGTAYRSRWRD